MESPATIQVIDQQTLQNSTNASIADNLQDIPGVEITDNSLAGRKQIRIRGEASSRVLILIDGQEVTYQRAGDNYSVGGFAPIFPDTCYHLTHYWLAAVDIPVASDNPVHYADAIRYNARTPLQGSLLPLTRLVWA